MVSNAKSTTGNMSATAEAADFTMPALRPLLAEWPPAEVAQLPPAPLDEWQGAYTFSVTPQAQSTMFLTIGAPGCGKSTWCQANIESSGRPTTVISMDDQYETFAEGAGLSYHGAWEAVNARREDGTCLRDGLEAQLDKACVAAIARGDDIIVDRTNMAFEHRARWLNKLVEVNYRKVGVVFAMPDETAQQRAKMRSENSHKAIPDFVYGLKAAVRALPRVPEEFDALLTVLPTHDFRRPPDTDETATVRQ